MYTKIFFFVIFFSYLPTIYGETLDYDLDTYFNYLQDLRFKDALADEVALNSDYNEELFLLAKLIEYNGHMVEEQIENRIIALKAKKSNDHFSNSLTFLIAGYFNFIDSSTRPKVFSDFNKAYDLAQQTDYDPLIKQCLLGILKLYKSGVIHRDSTFKPYLEHYKNLCTSPSDYLYYYSFQFNLFSQTALYQNKTAKLDSIYLISFNHLDSIREQLTLDHKPLVFYYMDKGNFAIFKNPTRAIEYFNRSLRICDSTLYYNPIKFDLFLHRSRAEAGEKFYDKALNSVKLSENYKNPNNLIKDDFALNAYKAEYFAQLKNYDSAYHHMKTSRYLEYQLNFQNQNAQIEKLQIENRSQQKELENLELKAKNTRNKNFLIAALILMVFIALTGFLVQNNTKKKQQLAQREKELESQKLATVLKEQELTSIDAMIEGQEKERQRIANDLHDHLGSLMANLKLHFNALKGEKSLELFDKTDELLEEAYQKIRSVSHAKNSGVLAHQGLLKAIQNMAKSISNANLISIQVKHHGLQERLENSLELTIFRIVQELITNVLKHSEANSVTIHLTQHEELLNIMVEDDGIGFNTKHITTKSSGIGLSTIDKRIEHLNGELTIESEIGQGTTVIIDIPI